MFTGTCVLAWTAAGFFGVQASQPPVTPGTGRAGAGAAVEPCGGRSAQPQVPCAGDVARMMEVLPPKHRRCRSARDKCSSTDARPVSTLVDPLAAKMIDEMGKKTGAWSTNVSYDPAAMSADSLKQYDAVFLSSTTGNVPRRSQQSRPHRGAAKGAARLRGEMERGWRAFTRRPTPTTRGRRARRAPARRRHQARDNPPCSARARKWRRLSALAGVNRTIGGYFKFHWVYRADYVRIDDPKSPINAAFKADSFNTIDEVIRSNRIRGRRENSTCSEHRLFVDDRLRERPRIHPPHRSRNYGLSWYSPGREGPRVLQALATADDLLQQSGDALSPARRMHTRLAISRQMTARAGNR